MRDISDNKYLAEQYSDDCECSFENFLFDRNTAPKTVDALDYLSAVREIVSALGFRVQYSGYNYLSRLVKHYSVLRDYTEELALERIGELYKTTADNVYANIVSVLEMNDKFIPRASKLLNVDPNKIERLNVTDAVEAIAALFKIYYNYMTDEFDNSDEVRVSINWEKVFSHGRQKSKNSDS